jgi:hypothetical protein
LAAIRNALYLAAWRSSDPEIRRYLRLADDEVAVIARILRMARVETLASQAALGRASATGNGRAVV